MEAPVIEKHRPGSKTSSCRTAQLGSDGPKRKGALVGPEPGLSGAFCPEGSPSLLFTSPGKSKGRQRDKAADEKGFCLLLAETAGGLLLLLLLLLLLAECHSRKKIAPHHASSPLSIQVHGALAGICQWPQCLPSLLGHRRNCLESNSKVTNWALPAWTDSPLVASCRCPSVNSS